MDFKGYEFSELFHVSLRKGVHSPYSAIIWNMISDDRILPKNLYGHFCKYVQQKLEYEKTTLDPENKRDVRKFISICKSWDYHSFMDDNYKFRTSYSARDRMRADHSKIIMFKSTIECMPNEDYEGVLYYINYCLSEQ